MIKVILLCPAVGTMEQPLKQRLQPLDEQQQQARTGTVTVNEDDSVQDDATLFGVAAADPLRTTPGGVTVEALRAKVEDLAVAVQIPSSLPYWRRVVVFEGAVHGDLVAEVAGVAGSVKSAELTFDDGNNNSPVSNAVANGTGLSTAVNAAIAAAKPSFSVQSLINKLDDIVVADGTKAGVAIVDQVAGKVYLYTTPTANDAAMGAAVLSGGGADNLAVFEIDSTPAAATEGQFGE